MGIRYQLNHEQKDAEGLEITNQKGNSPDDLKVDISNTIIIPTSDPRKRARYTGRATDLELIQKYGPRGLEDAEVRGGVGLEKSVILTEICSATLRQIPKKDQRNILSKIFCFGEKPMNFDEIRFKDIPFVKEQGVYRIKLDECIHMPMVFGTEKLTFVTAHYNGFEEPYSINKDNASGPEWWEYAPALRIHMEDYSLQNEWPDKETMKRIFDPIINKIVSLYQLPPKIMDDTVWEKKYLPNWRGK